MSELSRHTETFIVRLWVEYLEQTPPTWRGEIEHVGKEDVTRFGSLNEMSDFMKRCTTDKPIQNNTSKRKEQNV